MHEPMSDILFHLSEGALQFETSYALGLQLLIVMNIFVSFLNQGMEEILKCFIKEDSPEMNRQIHFIIKQLNTGTT